MGKRGFNTTIPYGTDLHEVTQLEYDAWDNAIGACDGSPEGVEWATYDILIGQGYFVSKPTCKRPSAEEQKEQGTSRTPGFTGQNYGGQFNGETGAWEPVWTQSRILAERDKLLKQQEKILATREKAFAQKVLEQRLSENARNGSTEMDSTNMAYAVLGGLLILIILYLFFRPY